MKKRMEIYPLFILQLLTNAATIGIAVLLNILIDSTQEAIASQNTALLQNILVVCIVYAVCTGALVYFYRRYKACFIRKYLIDMRNNLALGTLRTDIADFEKTGSASYITAFNQNISVVEQKSLENRISLVDSVISIVFGLAVLLWMNPAVALISIAFMSVPSLLPRLFTKALGLASANVMKSTTAYNETVGNMLGGFEVIKMYDAAAESHSKFSESANRMEKDKEHMSLLMASLYGLTNFASIAAQFLIMGLAGFFAVRGYITIGSIVAVAQLSGQVIAPAFALSAKIGEIKSAKPVLETLHNLSEPKNSKKAELLTLREHISMKNVNFKYEDKSVLEDVSATFEKGKKYAIIGKSGSGKSTLLKLLGGYYPVLDGDILVDERKGLPANITMIHQKTFLFNDTVRNNLTMWKEFPEQEIEDAVQKAGLTEFVSSLPGGLDTLVEENGSNFSGGECQRIAIARALLSGKDILLMDEATSNLDEKTASAVEQTILSIDGITCIHVTHRLTKEASQSYSKIFTMEEHRLHTAS